MITLEEVLNIEGIVIRKIPVEIVSRWRQYDSVHGKPRDTDIIVERNEEKSFYVVEETKRPKNGGKYLVTMKYDNNSIVHFDLKYNGVGDTIVEAYIDFIKKQGR